MSGAERMFGLLREINFSTSSSDEKSGQRLNHITGIELIDTALPASKESGSKNEKQLFSFYEKPKSSCIEFIGNTGCGKTKLLYTIMMNKVFPESHNFQLKDNNGDIREIPVRFGGENKGVIFIDYHGKSSFNNLVEFFGAHVQKKLRSQYKDNYCSNINMVTIYEFVRSLLKSKVYLYYPETFTSLIATLACIPTEIKEAQATRFDTILIDEVGCTNLIDKIESSYLKSRVKGNNSTSAWYRAQNVLVETIKELMHNLGVNVVCTNTPMSVSRPSTTDHNESVVYNYGSYSYTINGVDYLDHMIPMYRGFLDCTFIIEPGSHINPLSTAVGISMFMENTKRFIGHIDVLGDFIY